MKKLLYCFALLFLGTSLSAWSQTSTPATEKQNKTPAKPADIGTIDPAPVKENKTTPDSIVTTPKEGTSILTSPGTPNKKETKIKTKTTTRKKLQKP